MQLTNDQIKAVSEWMKEHGIDEHLIEKFEGDWIKEDQNVLLKNDGRVEGKAVMLLEVLIGDAATLSDAQKKSITMLCENFEVKQHYIQ